jgi:hypothetical protein
MDNSKNDGEKEIFSYGGVVYPSAFGDLILWYQIIEKAKEEETDAVIFVTDDKKEDWWWEHKVQGKKTLGPRPELIEEIRRVAAISAFHMYNFEQFLRHSQQYLKSVVSKEAIEQVGEVARSSRGRSTKTLESVRDSYRRAVVAVRDWLVRRFPDTPIGIHSEIYPDIAVGPIGGDSGVGVEIKVVDDEESIQRSMSIEISRAEKFLAANPLWQIELVFVIGSELSTSAILSLINYTEGFLPSQIDIVFGRVMYNEFGKYEFHELGRA